MAEGPGWCYELSDTARFVLAHGLSSTAQAPSRPLDDEAWIGLVDEADRHDLDGLLIDAVASGALPTTPGQRDAMAQAEIEATIGRMDYEQRAVAVLELFDAHGIEIRVLKGLAVARLDYPDDQWRSTCDLDVLIGADQLTEAVAVLVAAGGGWVDPEPTPGWIRLVGKGATVKLPPVGLEVDLHRILVWGPLGVRVPDVELWQTARAFELGARKRFTLGREETLLHVCAHLLVLGVTRAREVRDVAQMLTGPDLDVDRLIGLAERWGQAALLATAIRLAEAECALAPGTHELESWARRYEVGRRDALWLRTGAPEPHRSRGLEQLGVFIELGREPRSFQARRVLLRANFFPAPGTYATPWQRVGHLVTRLLGRPTPVNPTAAAAKRTDHGS